MDPRADFDQTGCAWPRAPVDPADAPGHAELFTDDDSQPDAPRGNRSFGQSPPAPTTTATPQPTPPSLPEKILKTLAP